MIGRQLASEGILWVASAMTIALVVTWLFVLTMHVRAVFQKAIMMPGIDEDKGELSRRPVSATLLIIHADAHVESDRKIRRRLVNGRGSSQRQSTSSHVGRA